jgi:hypothetical protein
MIPIAAARLNVKIAEEAKKIRRYLWREFRRKSA